MFRINIFWTNGMKWYFRKMMKCPIRLISPNYHLNLLTIQPDYVKNKVKIMIKRIEFMFRNFMKTTNGTICTFRKMMKVGIGTVCTLRNFMKTTNGTIYTLRNFMKVRIGLDCTLRHVMKVRIGLDCI